MMQRIVLHTSPRYRYRKVAFALAGLGAGAATLLFPFPPLLGIVVVVLSGTYSVVQLRALGEEDERVVIDDGGIRDSMLPVGVIGWDEVRGASVQRIGNVEVVSLQLRDPEHVISRLPSARQFIARKALEAGLPGVYLTLVGTEGDPATIAERINSRVRGQGIPPTPTSRTPSQH
jgi:hypothetical protein